MASKSLLHYQFIDNESSLTTSLSELKSLKPNAVLAVDCEGIDLSRKGELTIVTVASKQKAYIFDIVALKQVAFDSGLREILEDKSHEKLMFDCREDSDSLWHQFRVKLTGVLDVQLLEVMYRRERLGASSGASSLASYQRRSERINEVENLNGFRRCIELYIKDTEVLKVKTKVAGKMQDKLLWKRRPLAEEMLRYCAVDTLELFKLYRKLRGTNNEFLPRLRIASERYADMYRSKTQREYDNYEENAFLPLEIIPEKGSLTFPLATTKCTKCKRLFPAEEFTSMDMQIGDHKCRMCRKIKQRDDERARRNAKRYQRRFYYNRYDDYDDDYDYGFGYDYDYDYF